MIRKNLYIRNLYDCGLGEIRDLDEDDDSVYKVDNKYYYLSFKNEFSSLDFFQWCESEVA